MQVDQTKNKTKQNKTKQKKKKKPEQFAPGVWGGTFNLTRTLSFFTLVFQPRSWHKTTSEPKKSLRSMIFPGIPLTSLCIYKIWRLSQLTLCMVIKVIGWPAYPVQGFQSLLSLKSKILSYHHINAILVFEYKVFFYSKVIFEGDHFLQQKHPGWLGNFDSAILKITANSCFLITIRFGCTN